MSDPHAGIPVGAFDIRTVLTGRPAREGVFRATLSREAVIAAKRGDSVEQRLQTPESSREGRRRSVRTSPMASGVVPHTGTANTRECLAYQAPRLRAFPTWAP